MNLIEEPQIVNWPEIHYVFLERIGPFQITAPQAWQALHRLAAGISENNQITGAMSLYKVGPKIYRAGFSVSAAPVALPEGIQYTRFAGGKFSRFVLTGPYTEMPQASGRVWEIVAEKKITLRDEFAIEHYLNEPKSTPVDQLITEILVPTA